MGHSMKHSMKRWEKAGPLWATGRDRGERRPLWHQRYTHLCSDAISRDGFLYRPTPAPYIVAI